MREVRRCSHTFDPKKWEDEHEGKCLVNPEVHTEILEEVDGRMVWRCPHEAVEDQEKCVFHLPKEKRPAEPTQTDEFVAIVNGEREAIESGGQRPAQFIDGTFEGLNIDQEWIGDGETIDLRYARIERMEWKEVVVDAPLDAGGAIFEGYASFLKSIFRYNAYFGYASFGDEGYFMSATFENQACFDGATFENLAYFEYATFEDGMLFRDATFGYEAAFFDLDLEGANFRGADLSDGHLENAELEGADLRNADLTGANLENAVLTRTQLYETDFTDAQLHGTLFGDARIGGETTFVERGIVWSPLRCVIPYLNKVPLLSRVIPYLNKVPPLRCVIPYINKVPGVDISEGHTVIYDPRTDPVLESENEDGGIGNHTQAAAVYRSLESLARDNAASRLASTCFRWRKDMERKQQGSLTNLRWYFSWLSNLVTRYGESPYRVLITAALIILSWSGLYYWQNLIVRTEEGAPVSLFEAFYFSMLTFTTLGYGDFRPETWWGQLLAITETAAGVVLLALLVFVFGRRATR